MATKDVATRSIFDLAAAAMTGDEKGLADAFASADLGGDPAMDLVQAQSLDELDAAASAAPIGLEEVEGVKLRVLGVKVLPSTIEGGNDNLPFYVLASCALKDGTQQLVTIGGRTPLAYLVRRAQLGGIPMGEDEYLVFTKAKKATRAGYFPWNVAKVKGDSF